MAKKEYFAHKSCYIDAPVTIGKGTAIWHFCHIFEGAIIGKDCKIGQNVVIHSTAKVGNNVKIQNNVSVYDGVILEDDVFCGPSCVFTNVINPRSAIPRNSEAFIKKTLVRKGASIGANVTIRCGVTIGQYSFIGAGAVLTKDVGNYELWFGTPARRQGWMCECGNQIKFSKGKTICSDCRKRYKKVKNEVTKDIES